MDGINPNPTTKPQTHQKHMTERRKAPNTISMAAAADHAANQHSPELVHAQPQAILQSAISDYLQEQESEHGRN